MKEDICINLNKEKKELKPFVKWVGGKSQLIKQINEIISNDKSYFKYAEPMVGGGALLFHILSTRNLKNVFINDTNPELINTYNVIKSNVGLLIGSLKNIEKEFLSLNVENKKKYYYKMREEFNFTKLSKETSVIKATSFIFLNKTCFNGLYRVNKKGEFNVPMGSYKNPKICDEQNLININIALQNVIIKCADYTCVEKFVDNNTIIYFDPPYRPISKTSSFTSYNISNFNDNEQIRLATFFKKLHKKGAKIILSNSDPKNTQKEDDFFENLYEDFNIKKVYAYRMINSKCENRGKIKELLIYN